MLLTKTRKFQIKKKNPTCQSAIAIKFRVQCFVIHFFLRFYDTFHMKLQSLAVFT